MISLVATFCQPTHSVLTNDFISMISLQQCCCVHYLKYIRGWVNFDMFSKVLPFKVSMKRLVCSHSQYEQVRVNYLSESMNSLL